MKKPRYNLKNYSEKESLIIMFFHFKGIKHVLSTGLKINPKYWNRVQMRVRDSQDLSDGFRINETLEKLESFAISIARKFELSGGKLTRIEFKRAMTLCITGTDPDESQTDFTGFLNKFINERSLNPKYAPGSVEVYKTAQKHLYNYVKGKRIDFNDLSIDFFKGLTNYLYRLDFSDNHVNKILGTIRTILNEATELGMNKNQMYKSRKIAVGKTETDNVYLTETDLMLLATLDLTARPGLDRVRDLFLIASYTGLRFSDFAKLKTENIQMVGDSQVFNILTTKTKDRLIIPIHPVVAAVLRKYNYDLPEAISNQRMNDSLKEVCKLAGLVNHFTKRRYRGGKVMEEVFQKWELVSSHTGRRSFATNAYKAGVPMLSIMRITGHKKPETFLKYIKFDNTENAIILANHPFFSEKGGQKLLSTSH